MAVGVNFIERDVEGDDAGRDGDGEDARDDGDGEDARDDGTEDKGLEHTEFMTLVFSFSSGHPSQSSEPAKLRVVSVFNAFATKVAKVHLVRMMSALLSSTAQR